MTLRPNLRLLLPLLFLGAGCESSEDLTLQAIRDSAGVSIVENVRPLHPEGSWAVDATPLLELGADESDVESLLTYPASIHLRSDGRYLVGDGVFGGRNEIFVFEADGRLAYRCGGEGDGPGEFGQLWWTQIYRGDSIAAYDLVGHDVSIFDSTCRFAREIPLPQGGVRRIPGVAGFTSGSDGALRDGSILAYPGGWLDVEDGQDAGPAWYTRHEILVRPDGTISDTLGVLAIQQFYWNGSNGVTYPFGGLASAVPAGDRIVRGEGIDPEFRIVDPTGSLSRIVRWTIEPTPVTENDIETYRRWYAEQAAGSFEATPDVLDRVRELLDATVYPPEMPTYSSIVVSDRGEFWVEAYRAESFTASDAPVPARWFVFSETGDWLTTLRAPERFRISSVDGDRLLGFHVDAFEVRTAQIYRVRRNDPASEPSLVP